MNRIHYVVYWDEKLRAFTTTTPREWARQFGHIHGIDNNARTQAIEDFLKAEYRFVEFTFDNSVVLCNLDTVAPNFEKKPN